MVPAIVRIWRISHTSLSGGVAGSCAYCVMFILIDYLAGEVEYRILLKMMEEESP